MVHVAPAHHNIVTYMCVEHPRLACGGVRGIGTMCQHVHLVLVARSGQDITYTELGMVAHGWSMVGRKQAILYWWVTFKLNNNIVIR